MVKVLLAMVAFILTWHGASAQPLSCGATIAVPDSHVAFLVPKQHAVFEDPQSMVNELGRYRVAQSEVVIPCGGSIADLVLIDTSASNVSFSHRVGCGKNKDGMAVVDMVLFVRLRHAALFLTNYGSVMPHSWYLPTWWESDSDPFVPALRQQSLENDATRAKVIDVIGLELDNLLASDEACEGAVTDPAELGRIRVRLKQALAERGIGFASNDAPFSVRLRLFEEGTPTEQMNAPEEYAITALEIWGDVATGDIPGALIKTIKFLYNN